MPRPRCQRRISAAPLAVVYKPAGVPRAGLKEVILGLDEFEALRLADLEGMYQAEAAERMGVSRPTFGRIVEAARRKVAEALVGGKALLIEGGSVVVAGGRSCRRCQRPSDGDECPDCRQAGSSSDVMGI